MDQYDLLSKLLRLPNYWEVVEVQTDEQTRRLDLRLSFTRRRKQWLGRTVSVCPRCDRKLGPASEACSRRLRHLPIGEWQVDLLVPDEAAGCADRGCPANADLAEPGTRVTHSLARRLTGLLMSGTSLTSASTLLDLDVADAVAVLAARRMPVDALTHEVTVATGALPDEWDVLSVTPVVTRDALALPVPASVPAAPDGEPSMGPASGSTAPSSEPSSVAAPLPVAAVGWDPSRPAPIVPPAVSAHGTEHASCAPGDVYAEGEVDEYHDELLDAEIEAELEALTAVVLNETALPDGDAESTEEDAQDTAEAEAPQLPATDHAVWRLLLTGRLGLRTNALSLQMLLARLRQYLRSNGEDESALASAAGVAQRHLMQGGQRYADERAQLVAAMTEVPDSVSGEAMSRDAAMAAPSADSPSTAIPTLHTQLPAPDARIPALDHPVWRALVAGHFVLETESVALGMMLEQIRRSAQMDGSRATLDAGVRLLHSFFTKTSPRLGGELDQLQAHMEQGASPPPAAGAGAADPQALTPGAAAAQEMVRADDAARAAADPAAVPAESSPCWRVLVNGDVEARSSDPGLAMLLEKVRKVTRQGQDSDDVMAAAARVLRRYLLRYETRHAALINQLQEVEQGLRAGVDPDRGPRSLAWLGRSSGKAMPSMGAAADNSEVPPQEHPVWMRLVGGEFELKTEVFALRMMLERTRASVNRDPSEANRLAAAAQLREYFVKHERVHQAEIRRLRVA